MVANFVEVKEPDLDDRKTIISLLQKDGMYFKKLDDKYKRDVELVLIAIENNVETFKYVPHVEFEELDMIY